MNTLAMLNPHRKAEDLAFFADKTGEVIIYRGIKDPCEKVAHNLGGIGLKVTIID